MLEFAHFPASHGPGSPDDQALQLLTAARRSGDRRGEAAALADLGVLQTRSGDPSGAIASLEQALFIAREIGELSLEVDALGNLGLALVADGQTTRGLDVLEQELTAATAAVDPYAEKISLDNLGLAWAECGRPDRALPYYSRALDIARRVGDRQHEADLLWLSAVQNAELGHRIEAIDRAEQAVGLFRSLRNPHAELLADHLGQYRDGNRDAALPLKVVVPVAFGSFLSTDLPGAANAGIEVPADQTEAVGPGMLRMAFSAAKSVARFLASGLKTTPGNLQVRRLETCASCPHHTGSRCKLCGCFTRAKVIMPHEDCPIGKWRS